MILFEKILWDRVSMIDCFTSHASEHNPINTNSSKSVTPAQPGLFHTPTGLVYDMI